MFATQVYLLGQFLTSLYDPLHSGNLDIQNSFYIKSQRAGSFEIITMPDSICVMFIYCFTLSHGLDIRDHSVQLFWIRVLMFLALHDMQRSFFNIITFIIYVLGDKFTQSNFVYNESRDGRQDRSFRTYEANMANRGHGEHGQ